MESLELPTLEGARNKGLRVRSAPAWQFWNRKNVLAGDPDHLQKLGALWLDARLLIRSTRNSVQHVGPRVLSSLARAERKPEGEGQSRYIGALLDPAPLTCTFCTMSPGQCYCAGCGGEGYRLEQRSDGRGNTRTVRISCEACRGSGRVECGNCDGTAMSQRVDMVWVEDDWKELRYLYVPSLPFALESVVRNYAEAVESWPAALSMPLEEQLISGPYRSGPTSVEEFRGFTVDGPIDMARDMVDRIRGGGRVLSAEVSAYVLPLLHIRFGSMQVVIHHQVEGGMAVVHT
ncbi:MAG: hypothetical protein AB8H86_31380 [Polyangiales bacterium]